MTKTAGNEDSLPLQWIPVSEEEYKLCTQKELSREVPKGHVLHNKKVEAVAQRDDEDDVLFKLGEDQYAVVHLTYNKETDPQWPHTTLCTWDEFLTIAKQPG